MVPELLHVDQVIMDTQQKTNMKITAISFLLLSYFLLGGKIAVRFVSPKNKIKVGDGRKSNELAKVSGISIGR